MRAHEQTEPIADGILVRRGPGVTSRTGGVEHRIPKQFPPTPSQVGQHHASRLGGHAVGHALQQFDLCEEFGTTGVVRNPALGGAEGLWPAAPTPRDELGAARPKTGLRLRRGVPLENVQELLGLRPLAKGPQSCGQTRHLATCAT